METKLVYQNSKYAVLESPTESIYLRQPQPNYVTVVALREGKIVVVKQYRTAVEQHTYELPGGHVEEGEELEPAARRELREETGLTCGPLTYLGGIHSHACVLNRVVHLFFTDQIEGQTGQELDIDEDIEILAYTVEEAFQNIQNNTWTDTEMAHALLLARLKGLL